MKPVWKCSRRSLTVVDIGGRYGRSSSNRAGGLETIQTAGAVIGEQYDTPRHTGLCGGRLRSSGVCLYRGYIRRPFS